MGIREYLEQNGVEYQSSEHPPAYTAQDIAAEEHVSGDMLAKPVIIRDEREYAMCVLPASYKLDMQKVARARKAAQVRLADEGEMSKLFSDCELGAEPPFGNLYNMPTLVDEHLTADDEIVFQSGSHRQAIRMKYKDFESLTHPQVADLSVHM